MPIGVLRIHEGLFASGRLPSLARADRTASIAEIATLLLVGASAAVISSLGELQLRIPGHAILRAVFPMALGLAIVPRHMGGCVMGGSACLTGILLPFAGGRAIGPGALASLSLTGPLLDLALWGAASGWRLYVGFVLAGLGSNIIAFGVRAGARLLGMPGAGGGGGGGGGGGRGGGGGGGGGAADWWLTASISYPLCGILAGLISALIWFHLRRRAARSNPEPSP